MAAHALLASLLALALVTGAALARPLLQAPCNVRLDGTLRRSSAGARVPSPSSVGRWSYFTMAEDVAGASLLFAATWDHLPDILVVENVSPRPVKPGKAPSTTVAPETFGVTV